MYLIHIQAVISLLISGWVEWGSLTVGEDFDLENRNYTLSKFKAMTAKYLHSQLSLLKHGAQLLMITAITGEIAPGLVDIPLVIN